ncbi:MAG: carbamoyltransferase HypF [Chitinophagaceae bacterium]
MNTCHIHINGLVQGVGFRPYVYQLASKHGLTGWVSNSNTGVHIECSGSTTQIHAFYDELIQTPPANAIISSHELTVIDTQYFDNFSIQQSNESEKPDLLLTPDIAICDNCHSELLSVTNKRYRYPFTTCLHCGPRYSISHALPYDREHTSMKEYEMCPSCSNEYNDVYDRRHYSQTNSCKDCAVNMHFYTSPTNCLSSDSNEILDFIQQELSRGCILAVKGIGGYLLIADASNEKTIATLRTRKQRPSKPFALLYKNIEQASADVLLTKAEAMALKSKISPIVLCRLKENHSNQVYLKGIAPGLNKIGIMLPYAPLLLLIAEQFNKPLIATSANISGAPIIYKDQDALENLFDIADYVVSYDRDILTPQDDSVVQFTNKGHKIILRRSRGLAPNYFPNPFPTTNTVQLAMGAELKSAFALQDQHKLFISQFLGDQSTLESQQCFKETLQHIIRLLKSTVATILVDAHPTYAISGYGKELAQANQIPIVSIQHHKAHFAAVLAENNLLHTALPILGFIWDGTGFGEDKQIWGGEVFIYDNKAMKRVAHLSYFPQLLGDKMSKEPRIAALSLLKAHPDKMHLIQKYFSKQEWNYYQQLNQQSASLLTSSMGRFIDGIAALLGLQLYNTYEGEAALQLEVLAQSASNKPSEFYPLPLVGEQLDITVFIKGLIADIELGVNSATIAWKVFFSLAHTIGELANHFQIDALAFSGGIFQNALLNDIIIERLSYRKKLYFHQQLSPNDECIGLGQLAYQNMTMLQPSLQNTSINQLSSPPFQSTF